ncbi:hypothetical protein NLI96_g9413 [Meripilus lineatus]|uniref:Uncharacterized protein n=1 Tax=Meripilus lineatus TaxID=2056292 RepID=A0AAD5V038_9APHY|nr:hypothetical protein NLI96_g9413 [Physisporinus lineatus]
MMKALSQFSHLRVFDASCTVFSKSSHRRSSRLTRTTSVANVLDCASSSRPTTARKSKGKRKVKEDTVPQTEDSPSSRPPRPTVARLDKDLRALSKRQEAAQLATETSIMSLRSDVSTSNELSSQPTRLPIQPTHPPPDHPASHTPPPTSSAQDQDSELKKLSRRIDLVVESTHERLVAAEKQMEEPKRYGP